MNSIKGIDDIFVLYEEQISDHFCSMMQGIKNDKVKLVELAEKLASALKDKKSIIKNIDAIVPIPLHSEREKSRGFNQSYEISKMVAKKLDIPIISGAIERTKNTRQLKALSKEERETEIEEAFNLLGPELLKGKNLLVIDDVISSGTTLSKFSNYLKQAGAKNIFAAALFKVKIVKV
ncbi:ComF family protein [Elusimicrobiota bacterium]